MFFDNHDISFEISDVFHIKRNASKKKDMPRQWAAFALRVSGKTVFDVNGKRTVADKGSIVYIPEGIGYSRSSTNEELIILHLKCHGNETEKEIQVFEAGNVSVKLSNYFFEISKTWEQKSPGCKHRCTSILYRILEEMETFASQNPSSKKENIIKNSLIYMNMNFDNPLISIQEISKQSNISEVYFRKLYKDIFGISPSHAIQNMRIQRALELLQSGHFNISEVAEKSGFDNCKYFSALFRKVPGKSPSQYQKECK